MDSLISRKTAIDALRKEDPNCGVDAEWIIRKLPSAQPDETLAELNCSMNYEGGYHEGYEQGYKDGQSSRPERKTGKWYKPTGMMPPEYVGAYRCSNCNELAPRDWKHHKQILTNFCPFCGSYNGEDNIGKEKI